MYFTQIPENGYIVFRSEANYDYLYDEYGDYGRISDPTPSLFPEELSFVVAPFWADIDTSSAGNITYELHQTTGQMRSTDMETVSSFINNETGLTSFQGDLMLLVEWNQVPLYGSTFPEAATVSY